MSKNILYISIDGMTDPLGRSQVINYLIGLSKEGYNITILSAEKPDAFEKRGTYIAEVLKENNIGWHHITYINSPPIFSSILLIRRLKKAAASLHQEKSFSIVHCRSYMSSLVGHWLKKKFGISFIFDMRGFWADERVDGGLWPQTNLVYKQVYQYFKRKEKVFLLDADHTISLTHAAKEHIHSWSYLDEQKNPISVIPCCVDLDRFERSDVTEDLKSKIREKMEVDKSEFTIVYLGSIGTWYMIDEMLDFFKVLLEDRPKAKFVFVSKGEREMIMEKAAERNIPTDRIHVQGVDYEDVPVAISIADVSIFFILPVFSKMASSPVKQGEVMAMGIPLICNSGVGDTDRIVNDSEAGVVLKEMNENGYREVVGRLDEIRKMDQDRIRVGAENYYSLAEGVKRYKKVYESLLN